MKAFATLPDGGTEWLLYIEDWDFSWQDQYRFRKPVVLPEGATLHMEYTFDNSADNPRNPHHPPRRVLRGLRSSDEMAELLIQLMAHDPTDDAILESWVSLLAQRQTPEQYILHYRKAVEVRPEDAEAHFKLGVALDVVGETREAVRHLRDAIRLQPDWWRPVEALAWIRAASHDRRARDPEQALALAERAVELTQRQVPAALDALGAAYAAAGRFARAVEIAEEAAALAAAQGRTGLARTIQARADLYRGEQPYRQAPPR